MNPNRKFGGPIYIKQPVQAYLDLPAPASPVIDRLSRIHPVTPPSAGLLKFTRYTDIL